MASFSAISERAVGETAKSAEVKVPSGFGSACSVGFGAVGEMAVGEVTQILALTTSWTEADDALVQLFLVQDYTTTLAGSTMLLVDLRQTFSIFSWET